MIAASKTTTKMIIPMMSCFLVKRDRRLGFKDAFERLELFEPFELLGSFEPFEPFERTALVPLGFSALLERPALVFLSNAPFLVLILGDLSFSFAERATGIGRAAFDESSLEEIEVSAGVFDRSVSFIV
jgi:hypothetical protein